MPSAAPFHVLIIGGGYSGLALAHALQKHAVPYTLHERDSSAAYLARPRDWGSLLHWGQAYLRRCLPDDLWERRAAMAVDPWFDGAQACGPGVLWDAKTGAELLRPKAVDGTVRVSRAKARRVLSPGLNVVCGKRVVAVEDVDEEVRVRFEDGSEARGSVVVGCDGAKSKVREFVVGEEAAKGFDSDYTMINTWTTLPADVALRLREKHPILSQAIHPDLQVGALIATLDIPSPEAPPEDWKFQVYTGWKGRPRKADLDTNEKAMKHVKAIFEQIAEPFYSVGKSLPDDLVLPVDDGWNFKPIGNFEWNNHGGKVVLVGDAAHSMLPHRGQGLNNAIMDAALLAEALREFHDGQKTLAEAIQGYEDDMRPRGTKEVETTLETMKTQAECDLKKSPLFTIGLHRPEDATSTSNL